MEKIDYKLEELKILLQTWRHLEGSLWTRFGFFITSMIVGVSALTFFFAQATSTILLAVISSFLGVVAFGWFILCERQMRFLSCVQRGVTRGNALKPLRLLRSIF